MKRESLTSKVAFLIITIVVAALVVWGYFAFDIGSYCLGDVYHCGIAIREPDNTLIP